jgi:ADP-ribose pyrophosphatase YjhB (NUDIX family)
MRATSADTVSVLSRTDGHRSALAGVAVDRVRCVLRWGDKYLVARNNSQAGKIGKWGLVGGRLKAREAPKDGLRRELREELRLKVRRVVELGDWRHREENYRLFGCDIRRAVEWFDTDEIRAIAWLTYLEVVQLAAAGGLHKGFELAAIAEFQRRVPA